MRSFLILYSCVYYSAGVRVFVLVFTSKDNLSTTDISSKYLHKHPCKVSDEENWAWSHYKVIFFVYVFLAVL